ncbi:response regulator [Streptomyces sp. NPDC000658]|uniref:response regulator n=1 Tax=Streptomyces sp. NPDC000658 TaxID=3154266 RepID=UPI003322E419
MDTANLILDFIESLVWPAVVMLSLLLYRNDISDAIRRLKSLATPAGNAEFAEAAGVLLDEAAATTRTVVSAGSKRGVLRRLEHATEILKGGRLLWVDDHPEGNASLIQLFRAAGMEVDTAISTDEALSRLRMRSYDVILSDIGRQEDPGAGISMLRDLDEIGIDTPVVLYTLGFDYQRGFPRRAFAVTEAPDEVVHYVIDLIERARVT